MVELVKVKEKEHLFIDMDGVLADFMEKASRYCFSEKTNVLVSEDELVKQVKALPGFFRDLKPVEGSIESVTELSKKYQIYILSTPSWSNPSSWQDKRLWVEEHLGELGYKRLILCHNKGLFSGRALIDDRTKNGADKFKGEHILFGGPKFPGWKEVLDYL